jgi:hypothetical protein
MKNQFYFFIIFSIVCFQAKAADKWTSIQMRDGRIFRNVTVSSVDASGIRILHDAGVSRIFYRDLPDSMKADYPYDPKAAAEHEKKINDEAKVMKKKLENIEKVQETQNARKAEIRSRGEWAAKEADTKKQAIIYQELAAERARQQEAERISKLSPQERLLEEEVKALNSWMGSHKSKLIASWGVPSRTASDGKGGEVLVFENRQGPGIAFTMKTGAFTPFSTTVALPETFVCKEIYTNSDGVIYTWRRTIK